MWTADQQRRMVLVESTRPVCTGDDDCRAKWEAAQLWITHNAAMKLQTVTNVVIETYNPINDTPGFAAQATKEPLGDGRYRIVLHLRCGNLFGCNHDPVAAVQNFNDTVAAARP